MKRERFLTEGLGHDPRPETDTVALTCAKVEPMVHDLFPRAEQDVVLASLEKSVVFTTSANIESLLHECRFDNSAWTLANLYLASFGAELLGKDAPRLVGLSEETPKKASCPALARRGPHECPALLRAFHRKPNTEGALMARGFLPRPKRYNTRGRRNF
jgi:hypothetical protein